MPTKEEFSAELEAQRRRAALRGDAYLDVNAGDLHRLLGGYPGARHQMPLCCAAMYDAQRPGDEILSAPPRGNGASLTIRYWLPR